MKLLTPQEAAELLRLKVGTLAYRRCAGLDPAYIKMGKTVVYEEDVLISFAKRHTKNPSVQAGEDACR